MSSAWKLEEITSVRCFCFRGTEAGTLKRNIWERAQYRIVAARSGVPGTDDREMQRAHRDFKVLGVEPARSRQQQLAQHRCCQRRSHYQKNHSPRHGQRLGSIRWSASPVFAFKRAASDCGALFGRLQARAVRPAIEVFDNLLVARPGRRLLVLGTARLLDFLGHQHSPFPQKYWFEAERSMNNYLILLCYFTNLACFASFAELTLT